jgi:hypothetical protein
MRYRDGNPGSTERFDDDIGPRGSVITGTTSRARDGDRAVLSQSKVIAEDTMPEPPTSRVVDAAFGQHCLDEVIGDAAVTKDLLRISPEPRR